MRTDNLSELYSKLNKSSDFSLTQDRARKIKKLTNYLHLNDKVDSKSTLHKINKPRPQNKTNFKEKMSIPKQFQLLKNEKQTFKVNQAG